MINTSCALCLFAKFNEDGNQIGCEQNRLEKYQKRGIATLQDKAYLLKTFCNTCVRVGQEGLDITAQGMRDIVKINAVFIINGLQKDYWPLLKQILKQKLMPAKVVVIVKEFKEIEKYKEYLKYFSDKNSNLLIKKYYDPDPEFYQCVNESVSRYKTQYYTILDGDSTIDPEYLEKIDKKVNDDMEPLVAVFSDGEYRNTFSITLHNVFGGNKDKPLKQKIEELDAKYKEQGNIWQESTL